MFKKNVAAPPSPRNSTAPNIKPSEVKCVLQGHLDNPNTLKNVPSLRAVCDSQALLGMTQDHMGKLIDDCRIVLHRLFRNTTHDPHWLQIILNGANDRGHSMDNVINGIVALIIYTCKPVYGIANQSQRIHLSGIAEDTMDVSRASDIYRSLIPYYEGITLVLSLLPKVRSVTFRGLSNYVPPTTLVGVELPSTMCFTSTSVCKEKADRFAKTSMCVLQVCSGCSIRFASRYRDEDEILLPPGITFRIVGRHSATFRNVLRIPHDFEVYTLQEVGFVPTTTEVYQSTLKTLPLFQSPFLDYYRIPEVSSTFFLKSTSGTKVIKPLNTFITSWVVDPKRRHILLTGAGGSGKTAAMVYIASLLMQQSTTLCCDRPVLPLLRPLPLMGNTLLSSRTPSAIDTYIRDWIGIDETTLMNLAAQYTVVLLLESLDELSEQTVDRMNGFVGRNTFVSQCKVIISGRPNTAKDAGNLFGSIVSNETIELQPLSPSAVQEWCRKAIHESLPPELESTCCTKPFILDLYIDIYRRGQTRPALSTETNVLEAYLNRYDKKLLEKVSLFLWYRNWHCALRDFRAECGDDIVHLVPCRIECVEDETSDFSLLHRYLGEYVISRILIEQPNVVSLQDKAAQLLAPILNLTIQHADCSNAMRTNHISILVFQCRSPEITIPILKDDLVRLQKQYGTEHIEVVSILGNLGSAYGLLGDHATEKAMLEWALRIMEAFYGPDYVEVAVTLGNLGSAYGLLGDHATMKAMLERALSIKEAFYGPDHVEVTGTLGNLGSAYGLLGDHATEKAMLERALRIRVAFYGPDHVEVTTLLRKRCWSGRSILRSRPRGRGRYSCKPRERVRVARGPRYEEVDG